MMSFLRNMLFNLAALAAVATAADSRVALEPVPVAPSSSWELGARAPSFHNITVHVHMRHDNDDVEELRRTLAAVSDPRSPRYGNYLTLAEVGAMIPIEQSKHDVVRAFLDGAPDAVEVDSNINGDILAVTMTVRTAEELFQTVIHTFVHDSGLMLLRSSTGYTVPSNVATAVVVIADLASLPRVSAPSPVSVQGSGNWDNSCSTLSGCKGLITPAVLKKRYSVPDDETGFAGNTSFAVAEFQGQYFKDSDLKKFSDACGVNASVDTVVGGNQQTAGVEATLDIEYIKGLSDGIPLTVVYSSQYSLSSWVKQITSMADPPLVHSVSYGNDEAQQTSTAYMESTNTQFMAAGARGLSILFASGDQGVCGREGCGLMKKRFKPDFPAASPYITAVGGTDFASNDIGDETAWSDGGGGFSDTFPIPDWQSDVVSGYKSTANLPDASLFNNTGRGYPDIAALGGQKTPYCVVANGIAEGVAGTSASCPTAAAIFARLNGVRSAENKPALGFLNPFIYQHASAFNDVTTGNNKCRCGFSQQGFEATKGWDPTTGVGTPDFEKLKAAVLALP